MMSTLMMNLTKLTEGGWWSWLWMKLGKENEDEEAKREG